MENFVLTFQLATFVNDIFPESLINEAFENSKSINDVADFLKSKKDLHRNFDTYVTNEDRQRFFSIYSELNALYKQTSKTDLKQIKEVCNTEFMNFKKHFIESGFTESEKRLFHFQGIVLNYNNCEVPFSISRKYMSTGESWDSVKFSENERILAFRIIQNNVQNKKNDFIKKIDIEKSKKTMYSSLPDSDPNIQKAKIYNNYVDFIINTSHELGVSTLFVHNELQHDLISDILSSNSYQFI